ncbi:unnamed protein product [Boreogadus saida]
MTRTYSLREPLHLASRYRQEPVWSSLVGWRHDCKEMDGRQLRNEHDIFYAKPEQPPSLPGPKVLTEQPDETLACMLQPVSRATTAQRRSTAVTPPLTRSPALG